MIEKLFDTHVRASGNLDKVKSIKSQSDYIFKSQLLQMGNEFEFDLRKLKIDIDLIT